MALILFDTNIFIDMLSGVHQASIELNSYDMPAISFITYIELRCGEYDRPQDKPILDAVLAEFHVYHMDQQIMEAAIEIRGRSLATKPAIKLPDAIIAATARVNYAPVVTRNAKDFALAGVAIHIPYDYDSKTGLVTNIRQPFEQGPHPTLTRIR